MPRVSEIEDSGGDPVLKEIFEREREMFGGLLNPTMLAFAPEPGALLSLALPALLRVRRRT